LTKTEEIKLLIDIEVDTIVVSTLLEESNDPSKIIEEFLAVVATSK
jgi:3-keto-L-gulonate-6-phosphate decarboxylase